MNGLSRMRVVNASFRMSLWSPSLIRAINNQMKSLVYSRFTDEVNSEG